jgi:hypothetical protein
MRGRRIGGKALGSLSNFAEDTLINHIFNTAMTAIPNVYVALATGTLTDVSTGASMTEVANANGYQRTLITFGAAATRQVIQNIPVTFPPATGPWGTIVDWAIVDTQTYGAGNILAYGSFTASFSPVSGNTPTIPTTEIKVQMTASSGAGFVDATVHKLFDRMFRNQAYAKPATYIGLATATIADTAADATGITEVSGGSYARVQVNPNGGGGSFNWTVASGGAVENVQAITFPTPSAGWGTITSCFIIDSASGAGNLIGYDNANILDQTVAASDTVQFAIGAFDVAIS